MGKIAIMSDTLASQVAAGEVIERPASVVKELVENSLDAGAKQVLVEIQRGGVAGMRVTDDGCGMSREDAVMSLRRHATSKLKSSADLERVQTMGFRGEAIPSIASVGRFKLLTCEQGAPSGTELRVDGGGDAEVRDAGCAAGAVVEVRDLFYNIPARRKFLKAESTESAHVEHQIRLQALAHPQVRFTLKKDGRTVFDLPGVEDVRMRISGLNGADLVRDMVEVEELVQRGVTVRGYVLKAVHARGGRKHQFFFLNNRPIEDSALSAALRDGFGPVTGPGLNPGGWLWLELDAALVDVNVHPAKREVRFHKVHEVREAVREAVARALRPAVAAAPAVRAREVAETVPGETRQKDRQKDRQAEVSEAAVAKAPSLSSEAPVNPGHAPVQSELPQVAAAKEVPQAGHNFRVIGPLRDKYFALEGDEGLVLLDPQAARERVVYEQMLASAAGDRVESQGLLVPLILDLDARDADIVLRHSEHFHEIGIELEDFGKGSLQVRAVPAFLGEKGTQGVMLKMVDELVESGGVVRRQMAFESFAARLAGLVARSEKVSSVAAENLLDELFGCDLPFCGADGRPTLIQLSLQELDRRFGRR